LTRGSGSETEFVYIPFHKYGDAAKATQGEVGAMHEVRFIESEGALVDYGKGADIPDDYTGSLAYTDDKFDVHHILFPTQDAFATVGLKGMGKIKFNSQAPSDVSLNNPYGTKGFFSYNFFYAGLILESEKLLKISTLASK
jgi:N4-gp56 family major capsid protein